MSKYGNRKVQLDGYTFDSKAEARRYMELKLRIAAGEIVNLMVHPRFEIIPAFVDNMGRKVRGVDYVADFEYQEMPSGNRVVEDVKGRATEAFKIKSKLFRLKWVNREFRLIEA